MPRCVDGVMAAHRSLTKLKRTHIIIAYIDCFNLSEPYIGNDISGDNDIGEC